MAQVGGLWQHEHYIAAAAYDLEGRQGSLSMLTRPQLLEERAYHLRSTDGQCLEIEIVEAALDGRHASAKFITDGVLTDCTDSFV